MYIDDFLSRLSRVKQTGKNNFTALCPAHDDRHPSLSITFNDQGIAVYCHSQHCTTEAIVEGMALHKSDLFFGEKKPYSNSQRKQFNAAEILALMSLEVTVVVIAATQLMEGLPLNHDDMERLKEAHLRLSNANEVINAKFR